MKTPILFSIGLAGVVFCALPNVAMAQPSPGDSQGGQAAAIEGTWIVTVDRVLQNTKFSALQSFTAGGVVLATGTLDRTPPPPISPLYGSWTRTDNNTYVATLNFFIFDPSGNAVVMLQNNETFHLTDDNHLTGVGTACTWNIVGGIIQNAPPNTCSPIASPITITGTRLIAQGASN
jgi:hypothetical protein